MKALLVMPDVQRRSMGGNLHTHAVWSLLTEGARLRGGKGVGQRGAMRQAGVRRWVVYKDGD